MNISRQRTTEEVFEDHLRLRLAGNLDEDLRRNYSEDVILLTVNSNARGHDALRMSARRLSRQLPDAQFKIAAKQVAGPYALLIWSARSSRFDAVEGADSFVIENGKIVFQSIHYGLALNRGDRHGVTEGGHAPTASTGAHSANCGCPLPDSDDVALNDRDEGLRVQRSLNR